MKSNKPVFKSSYSRRSKMFHIEAIDSFGVKFVHNCFSKEERDKCKREWKNSLNKKPEPIIEPTPVRGTPLKKKKDNSNPIHYYYLDVCEGEGMKYSIENFHAKMLDEEGEQFFMMIGVNGRFAYVDELQVAKFFLMNKWERDHFTVDDRYVEYWHSYRFRKGYYLVIVLPVIKFRDNQIGFFIRVPFGREITYREAKRVWNKVDSIGFEKFEIAFDDIPKTVDRKRLCLDERLRRLRNEKIKRMNNELKTILKIERVELEEDIREKNDIMRIRVPKHYRTQRKVLAVNIQFGKPIDRKIKEENKKRELYKLLKR